MLFNILCFCAGLFLRPEPWFFAALWWECQICFCFVSFSSRVLAAVPAPALAPRLPHMRLCHSATVPQQYHGCHICLCKNGEEAERKKTPEHQVSSNTMEPQQIAQRTGKMQRGQGETFQSTRCTNHHGWLWLFSQLDGSSYTSICHCKNGEDAKEENTSEHQVPNTMAPQQIALLRFFTCLLTYKYNTKINVQTIQILKHRSALSPFLFCVSGKGILTDNQVLDDRRPRLDSSNGKGGHCAMQAKLAQCAKK